METVGQILRSERERRGLSIKDIETATSIRALYINAIEEGNFKIIPGEVYLKGFIRNYASYLDLNPQEMMDIYRNMQSEVESPKEAPSVSPAPQTSPSEPETKKNPPARSSLGRWLMVGFATVCLAGGVIWWLTDNNSPAPPQLKEQTKNTPPVTPPPTPSTPPTIQSPTTPPPSATAAKPVVITAKFTDSCWIYVTADGKDIYEGTQKSGDSLTWQAQGTITLKAGNAGGVDVTYNGQPIGKLGEKGEVIVKTFSVNTKKP